MGLNTTPRTWVAGEVVTAAEMNAEVRDAFTGIQAAWTSYTPSWTSNGTAPALGNGTLVGAYFQMGKTILWRFTLTAGSTTTFGTGAYFISLPFTPNKNPSAIGQGLLQQSGSAYTFTATYWGDAGPAMRFYTTAASPAVAWAATAPVTFANGNVMTAQGAFEIP